MGHSRSVIQEALLICFVYDLRYFLFVCLFLHRFIKSFYDSFLATFLETRYQHCQHWPYRGVGSVSFLAEEAEN